MVVAEMKLPEGRGGAFLGGWHPVGKLHRTGGFWVGLKEPQTGLTRGRHSRWEQLMIRGKKMIMSGEPGKLEARDLFSAQ